MLAEPAAGVSTRVSTKLTLPAVSSLIQLPGCGAAPNRMRKDPSARRSVVHEFRLAGNRGATASGLPAAPATLSVQNRVGGVDPEIS